MTTSQSKLVEKAQQEFLCEYIKMKKKKTGKSGENMENIVIMLKYHMRKIYMWEPKNPISKIFQI